MRIFIIAPWHPWDASQISTANHKTLWFFSSLIECHYMLAQFLTQSKEMPIFAPLASYIVAKWKACFAICMLICEIHQECCFANKYAKTALKHLPFQLMSKYTLSSKLFPCMPFQAKIQIKFLNIYKKPNWFKSNNIDVHTSQGCNIYWN